MYVILLNYLQVTGYPKISNFGYPVPEITGITENASSTEVARSNPAVVKFSLFIQNLSKNVPSQFPLLFIT